MSHWKAKMKTFALAHPSSPKSVTAWCRPLISYDPRFKGLVPFECLNGGWHGKFDPAKNVIHTRDDDLAHPMPAIKVWEGETPDLGHNEAIRWIEDQIK